MVKEEHVVLPQVQQIHQRHSLENYSDWWWLVACFRVAVVGISVLRWFLGLGGMECQFNKYDSCLTVVIRFSNLKSLLQKYCVYSKSANQSFHVMIMI